MPPPNHSTKSGMSRNRCRSPTQVGASPEFSRSKCPVNTERGIVSDFTMHMAPSESPDPSRLVTCVRPYDLHHRIRVSCQRPPRYATYHIWVYICYESGYAESRNTISTRVPHSFGFSTMFSRAPCRAAISRAMARPRPQPSPPVSGRR